MFIISDTAETDEWAAQSGGRSARLGHQPDDPEWSIQQDGRAWTHAPQPEVGGDDRET